MSQVEGRDESRKDEEAYRRHLIERLRELGAPAPDVLKDVFEQELVRRRYWLMREAGEGGSSPSI
jgi:hypothetical protein